MSIDQASKEAGRILRLFGARGDAMLRQYEEGTATVETDRETLAKSVAEHLEGRGRVGIFLLDQGMVRAAAIDLDAHGPGKVEAPPEKARELASRLGTLGLASHIERTKRKPGRHVLVFFKEPVPAGEVRAVLRREMTAAGLGGTVELFPKQSHEDSTDKGWGSGLWLPYFGKDAESGLTVIEEVTGEVLSLTAFLDRAEASALSAEEWRKVVALCPQLSLERSAPKQGNGNSNAEEAPPPLSSATSHSVSPARRGNTKRWSAGVLQLVSAVAERWRQGMRHQLVLHLAGALRRAGHGLDAALEALELLLWMVRDADEPQRLSDWQRAVRDTYGKPAEAVSGTVGLRDLGVSIPAAFSAPISESGWVTTPAHLLASVDGPRVEWIVEGLIPQGELSLIVGPPKIGKTLLGTALAVSVAAGEPFAGKFPVRQGAVLLIMEEDQASEIAFRLRILAKGIGRDLARLPIETLVRKRFRLGEGIAWLQGKLAALKPTLVVIDSLSRVHSCRENDVGEMSSLLGPLAPMVEEHKSSLVLLHHVRKPQNGVTSIDLNDVRGSGDLTAYARSNLLLGRDGTNWRLRVIGNNNPHPGCIISVSEPAPETMRVDYVCGLGEAKKQVISELIAGILGNEGEPLATSEIMEKAGKRKEDVIKALRKMHAEGRVLTQKSKRPCSGRRVDVWWLSTNPLIGADGSSAGEASVG